MALLYSLHSGCWRLSVAFGLLLPVVGQAQAPSWSTLASSSYTQNTGASLIRATAVDALGNVLVTGNFSGEVVFGNTVLTSAGSNDLFVAKYVPSTNSWAWAQSGGGSGNDWGNSIAVSNGNIYITGLLTNNTTNANAVLLGGTGPATSSVPQYGANATVSNDVLVAKYVDNGSSAQLMWTQVSGGRSSDMGKGIAVSGSNVYVTGYLTNDAANTFEVLFGGSGTRAGTARQYGTSRLISGDLFVAKYTDNGNSATLGWTQVGGGNDNDNGTSIATSGTSVYVTGALNNNAADVNSVRFGGSGTTAGTVAQSGASATASADMVVAKYTDNGANAFLRWLQIGGGSSTDFGQSIAVNGTSVYVTGNLTNNAANSNGVLFDGSGATVGTVQVNGASATAGYDIFVAKYTDAGNSATLGWTQVGGGTGSDQGYGIAAKGTGVFVTGTLFNNATNANAVLFGGTGIMPGTATQAGISPTSSGDVLVARYTDQGNSAALNWTQVGGGPYDEDFGFSIAAGNAGVYVGGTAVPVATFGSFTLAGPTTTAVNFLVGFGPIALVALQPQATAATGLHVFPNPATGSASIQNAPPKAEVRVLDTLGRLVLTTTTDAWGAATLRLPVDLPAGLYIVQAGGMTTRLVVD